MYMLAAFFFFFLHTAVKKEAEEEYMDRQIDKETNKLLLDMKGLLRNV
jgi:hypothetical protein